MDEYIKKSEAVDVIVKYPYDIAGKTATAIKMMEDLPSADVVPKSTVESIITLNSQLEAEVYTLKDNNEHLAVMLEETKIELEAMRGAANSLKMHYEKAEAEVKRLRGILLQFTDIVHKWGAKNNIDTTEISLVPILQEEADSIIKKANQELEAEIDRLKHILNCYALQYGTVKEQQDVIDKANQAFAGEIFANLEKLHLHITNDFDLRRYNELKKKYTEGVKKE